MTIRELRPSDYEDVLALWETAEGVALGPSDTPEQIEAYLLRNPGFSFAAVEGAELVAAVLCGHDGRRGYIHHLAVAPDHRRRGLGEKLVDRCMAELKRAGIYKCHLFVEAENREALEFWKRTGWTRRDDLEMYSKLPEPEG
jgi:ribosomal protein S18 acetylase RimI-like enzyme